MNGVSYKNIPANIKIIDDKKGIDMNENKCIYKLATINLNKLATEVEEFAPSYLLAVSELDVCDYLEQKYQLSTPNLRFDEKSIVSNTPTILSRAVEGANQHVNVQGQAIVIAIPFDGDHHFIDHMDAKLTGLTGRPGVGGGFFCLHYEILDKDRLTLKDKINQDVSVLESAIKIAHDDIANFNTNLSNIVHSIVLGRKRTIAEQQGFALTLEIPLRRLDAETPGNAFSTIKRKPRIERPTGPNLSLTPEPTLAMSEYDYILSICHNMAVMLERSPRTFAKLNEEEIRDHFLVQLNGSYEGRATGETFNNRGKTDILIRESGSNVFIAECKFWSGSSLFRGTIDQLLAYASWRDTKTAIFLFNRNKNFTKVLDQLPTLVRDHPNYKSDYPGRLGETRFRYKFNFSEDLSREMLLTVCAFNIPTLDS